jgi:hypothetical protein
MEFDSDGGVICLNPQGTALAMFDKQDVYRSFKCGYSNGIVTPPNLGMFEQIIYVSKAKKRKGGYNWLVRNMVIEASLMKNNFHDSFLWAMQ